MRSFQFFRANTLDDCLGMLEPPGVQALAGGQSLLLEMKERREAPRALVSIGGLGELRRTGPNNDGELEIGGLTTYRALSEAQLGTDYTQLGDLVRDIADTPVRTMATVGGALCQADRRFDVPVIAVALDAAIELASCAGTRRVAAEEFIISHRRTARASDELLTKVIFPKMAASSKWAFRKFRLRRMDSAAVSVAVRLQTSPAGVVQDARVVVGACMDRPTRIPSIEASLADATLSREVIRSVESDLRSTLIPEVPGTFAGNYLASVAGVLLREGMQSICGSSDVEQPCKN
jgi:carbon-monoxide dehydrogenase medium subunit